MHNFNVCVNNLLKKIVPTEGGVIQTREEATYPLKRNHW